ncbi:hypothetical protein [Methylobacterium sp. 275MFSha3.1]|uniref:hypothetical protein n=1 Tax=Methylobacterium sp. 275MFSha3.1 TaxID=1502746 RepID=UPI0011153DC1|nr:hypothetical protein [Methylobacterium sp. 275MFSha3.1]
MQEEDGVLPQEFKRLDRENSELARDKRLMLREISLLNAQLNSTRRSLSELEEFRREAATAVGLAGHAGGAAQVHNDIPLNSEAGILSKIAAQSTRNLYLRVALELEANKAPVLSELSDVRSLRPMQEVSRNRGAFRIILLEAGILDADWYILANPDVQNACADPYEHFAYYGDDEFRAPRAGVNPLEYVRRNPDVAESAQGPTFHYFMYGIHEGRSGYFC